MSYASARRGIARVRQCICAGARWCLRRCARAMCCLGAAGRCKLHGSRALLMEALMLHVLPRAVAD
eukprot:6403838-Alexandrium_andersonii.AAC.1